MTLTTRAAGLLAASLLLAVPLAAQRPTDIVKWTAKPVPAEVRAGAAIQVEITADVQPGWFLYGLTQPKGGPIPLRFAGAKGSPFEVQAKGIKGPEPIVKEDPVFDLATRMHEGKAVFTVPVTVRGGAGADPRTIPIEITFQACGNGICLRPYTHTVEAAVNGSR
jgi:hypothetical protein